MFQVNASKKQAEVAILIDNKIDVQPKVINQDEEGHFIFIKEKKNPPRRNLNSEHLCPKQEESTFIKES